MSYIPDALRRQVIERANGCCEYCRLGRNDTFFAHEVDHIIAEKHHGPTTLDNLGYSCFECNRHKGSDIASIDTETGQLTPLFHPRRDTWSDHFRLLGTVIEPLTAVGRVTVHLLQMNDDFQLAKRAGLIALDLYPCR